MALFRMYFRRIYKTTSGVYRHSLSALTKQYKQQDIAGRLAKRHGIAESLFCMFNSCVM